MTIATTLDRIDKKYAWSLLGFVLAIIFGALSIYTEFIRERRPHLKFEVISDASVLDVREKLGNLEILYDGVDIQKTQKSLRIVILRIINDGSQDILKNDFDDKAPLGFRIVGGSLVRAELQSGSSPYLQDVSSLTVHAPDLALLSPVILETGEWLTIKCLVLHAEGTRPIFQVTGKVAGIRDIRLVDSSSAVSEVGFWELAFGGGVWTQATRLISYFFGFIVLLVAIFVPLTYVFGEISKSARRRLVRQFRAKTELKLVDADEFIFDRYVSHDAFYLLALQRAVENPDKLTAGMLRHKASENERSSRHEDLDDYFGFSSNGAPPSDIWRRAVLREMAEAGFVIETGGMWCVDPRRAETLNEFRKFLRAKGVI